MTYLSVYIKNKISIAKSKSKVYNLLHEEDVLLKKEAGSRTTALKLRYIITKIMHLGRKTR